MTILKSNDGHLGGQQVPSNDFNRTPNGLFAYPNNFNRITDAKEPTLISDEDVADDQEDEARPLRCCTCSIL